MYEVQFHEAVSRVAVRVEPADTLETATALAESCPPSETLPIIREADGKRIVAWIDSGGIWRRPKRGGEIADLTRRHPNQEFRMGKTGPEYRVCGDMWASTAGEFI